MKKTAVVIPREHGGWAMIVLPYMIGMAASQPVFLHFQLFMAWLFLYLAAYPLLQSLKKTTQQKMWLSWGTAYAVIALACLIPVLILKPWLIGFAPVLIVLILINIWHVRQKAERALFNDICAILLFCSGGAAAYMLGGGGFDYRLGGVLLFNFLYFMGTVFFVKSVFRERKNKRWAAYAKIYHAIVLVLPLLTPYPWMCLSFLYPLVKTLLYAGKTMRPMKVGIMEIIGSIQFLILA